MAGESFGKKINKLMGNLFTKQKDDDEGEYDDNVQENNPRSVYDTLHGDRIKPVTVEDNDYIRRHEEDEYNMLQTNINPDTSAYVGSGIEVEVIRPNISFSGDITYQSIMSIGDAVITALKKNKTVFLDMVDLGEDERNIFTYVIIGAVRAMNYTMTAIRDHVTFSLTPQGVNVKMDERVKREKNDEGSRYTYSNDYN